MMSDDELAKLIAENLPSPMAQDMVWRQTSGRPMFDLTQAHEYAEEWRTLARIVKEALK